MNIRAAGDYNSYSYSAETASNANGYTALWAAVMIVAIEDMDIPGGAENAKRWIFGDGETAGSFIWICDMLDLDYNRLQMACMSREGRKELLQRHSWQRWLKPAD
jgi:hypothetical protein